VIVQVTAVAWAFYICCYTQVTSKC